MALFDPAWVKNLTPYIRPSDIQVGELDSYRKQMNLDDETFSQLVKCSPASLRKIVDYHANEVKKYDSHLAQRDFMQMTYEAIVMNFQGVKGSVLPAKFHELRKAHPAIVERSTRAIGDIQTMDDLVGYLLTEPEFAGYAPQEKSEIRDRVDQILGWHGSKVFSRIWKEKKGIYPWETEKVARDLLEPFAEEIRARLEQDELTGSIAHDFSERFLINEFQLLDIITSSIEEREKP